MSEPLARRIDTPQEVDLAAFSTGRPEAPPLTKEEGQTRLAEAQQEIGRLQELLYAAQQHSLLLVFQGMDTSGKDGTISRVAGAMSPIGVRVASFRAPTPRELAHDFLWRVHPELPGRGQVTVFNRSHYEDVLAVRVRRLAPEPVWRQRYEHILAFERLITDATGMVVMKFFLHLSKDEQERRLRARETDPRKAWKLAASDWEDRALWDDFQAAYAEAIGRTAVPHAPWWIVPADRKWLARLAAAEAVVEALRPLEAGWMAHLEAVGRDELRALRAARSGRQ